MTYEKVCLNNPAHWFSEIDERLVETDESWGICPHCGAEVGLFDEESSPAEFTTGQAQEFANSILDQ